MEKLTQEQIDNWRNVLLGMLGPYAILMTDEQIEAFRDAMQRRMDNIPENDSEMNSANEYAEGLSKQAELNNKSKEVVPMQSEKPLSAMELALKKKGLIK